MRHRLFAALGICTIAGAPLFAQGPPPPAAPVPYQAPAPPPSVYQQSPPAPPAAYSPPSEGLPPPTTPTVPSTPPLSPYYDAPPPQPRLIPVEREPYHVWVSGEILLWWVKSSPLPAPIALVVDGAGNSNTVIGNSNVGFGAFTGGRFVFGAWFDRDNTVGFEMSFFGLENRSVNQGVSSNGSGSPAIGLSFVSPGAGEFIQPLSAPGANAGNIFVSSNLELWGTEINAALKLWHNDRMEITALAGFRYMDLRENLYISGSSTLLATGDFLVLNDQFSTHNQFYGGQVGARFSWQQDRLSFDATGKIAIGGTHETLDIQGNSFTSTAGGFPGGFYAQGTNSGHYTATQFGFIPSLELKVSYQLSRAWRIFVGYDFMYWNQVIRPGNQIDRNINLSQSAVLGGRAPSPAQPPPRAALQPHRLLGTRHDARVGIPVLICPFATDHGLRTDIQILIPSEQHRPDNQARRGEAREHQPCRRAADGQEDERPIGMDAEVVGAIEHQAAQVVADRESLEVPRHVAHDRLDEERIEQGEHRCAPPAGRQQMEQRRERQGAPEDRRPIQLQRQSAMPAPRQTNQREAAQIHQQAPGEQRDVFRQEDGRARQGPSQHPEQIVRLAFAAQPLGGERDAPHRQQEGREQREHDGIGKNEEPGRFVNRGVVGAPRHLLDRRRRGFPGGIDGPQQLDMHLVGRPPCRADTTSWPSSSSPPCVWNPTISSVRPSKPSAIQTMRWARACRWKLSQTR